MLVLVDDVVTTGATLRSCRAALAGEGRAVALAVVLADATHDNRPGIPAI
jgi:predicted amidophosphoribosyltransferase